MASPVKKLLKTIISNLGYELSAVKKTESVVIPNVFNTSYTKTALLSYIKGVFIYPEKKNDRTHTNRYTTFLIGEVLNELGYNVDVIDCGEDYTETFNHYDLVIGLGKALDYVIENRNTKDKTKVIWFGTGCNPLYSNSATLNRLRDFNSRNKQLLFSSTRYIEEDWPLQHEFSDGILLHGSNFAKSTYQVNNIYMLHAPVFIYHSVSRTKSEWEEAKKNYIWFGTGGLIHKGLDLLLDIFNNKREYNLHICGNIESEPAFFNYARQIIDSNVNIVYHGFVDVKSEKFKDILRACAFVIFPSASEGNSPSVITCMANGGLIPIVPKSADVDLNGYGVEIKDLSIQAVQESIEQSQLFITDELINKSEKIIEETSRYNTFNYFKQDFKLKLQELITKI